VYSKASYLSWVTQHPPMHHPKNPISSVFFFLATIFLSPFFLTHPWPQVFFWKASTYSNPPTALIPTNPPTSSSCWPPPHPPPFALTSIARASRAPCTQELQGLGASGVPQQQELHVVVARAWKQKELKWELEVKLPSPPPSFFFLFFSFCCEEDYELLVIVPMCSCRHETMMTSNVVAHCRSPMVMQKQKNDDK
jgi:hypothetical protein